MLMKKLFLSFVMLFMAVSGAWAQYVVQGGLRFSLHDSDLKYAEVEEPESGTYSGVINIPSSVSYGGEDYIVKYIGGNAFKESAVTKVTIPSSVTHILNNAFQGCASLTEVNLSEGLVEIGTNAFHHPRYGDKSRVLCHGSHGQTHQVDLRVWRREIGHGLDCSQRHQQHH